ncbi:MAG: Do family serine endopeptidase [Pseudomonadota bacterium]|nr:Do family serine endopeptidase [Pseudomonadota bacterium]
MLRFARPLALVSITALATAAVVLPDATAQSTVPAIAQSTAPQLVSGLPDFTNLVEQVGPAVVNIEAGVTPKRSARAQAPGQEEIPEIFRRFFGPDAMPGMPGMPGPGGPGGPRGPSMGSGFIISADGYVLTNHHVVDGADEVKVKLSDRREFIAKVVGSDKDSDVALLKINATGLPSLRTGDSKTVKPGQWVVAIGSPFGLDRSVTAGIVSAVGRANPYAGQQYVPFIQTDVAINRGNSGGPLLNTRGEAVGINSQIFSNSGGYMGVSFAIPIDLAMNVTQQLRTTGSVRRGLLGVQIQPGISADEKRALGLPDSLGAIVAEVQAGGAAEKAGIERMDVIRAINGSPISQSSDVPVVIGAMAPGARATVTVFREGKTMDVPVVLGQLTDEAIARANASDDQAPTAASASNPLGIVTENIDVDDRSQFGLKAGEGVAISRVEGLAARRAGLQPGDLILSVGRKEVGTTAALNAELRNVKAGETVMLLVRRGNSSQYIAVSPRMDGEDEG